MKFKFEVPELGEVKVSSKFRGEGRTRNFDRPHFRYQICVETVNGKCYFMFHNSQYNWSKNKRLDLYGLVNAFDCIMSDIYCYINDEIYVDDEDDVNAYNRLERALKSEYDRMNHLIGQVSIDELNDCFVKAFEEYL